MYDEYEVNPKFYYTIKCLDIDTFAYVNHQILFRIFDCECRENDRCTVDKGGESMSDLISRQAAIDALENTKKVAK